MNLKSKMEANIKNSSLNILAQLVFIILHCENLAANLAYVINDNLGMSLSCFETVF